MASKKKVSWFWLLVVLLIWMAISPKRFPPS